MSFDSQRFGVTNSSGFDLQPDLTGAGLMKLLFDKVYWPGRVISMALWVFIACPQFGRTDLNNRRWRFLIFC